MVDNASSEEPLDDEFVLLLVKRVQDLHAAALNHVHFTAALFFFVKEFAVLDGFLFHVENQLVLDNFGQVLEELDLVEADFKEHFEWVFVKQDVLPHELAKICKVCQKLVVLLSRDLRASDVVF